ncbi:hypothetical protein H632_c4151p0, partial [Helicosporidium sp. ATCC 50920]
GREQVKVRRHLAARPVRDAHRAARHRARGAPSPGRPPGGGHDVSGGGRAASADRDPRSSGAGAAPLDQQRGLHHDGHGPSPRFRGAGRAPGGAEAAGGRRQRERQRSRHESSTASRSGALLFRRHRGSLAGRGPGLCAVGADARHLVPGPPGRGPGR